MRQEKFHNKLAEHTVTANKERCKREGLVYAPGIGMNGGYADEDDPDNEPTANNKKKKGGGINKCNACGELGHKRKTNKKCKYYKKKKGAGVAAIDSSTAAKDEDSEEAQIERDADELDLLDQLCFDEGDDNGDEFFDAMDSFDDEEE